MCLLAVTCTQLMVYAFTLCTCHSWNNPNRGFSGWFRFNPEIRANFRVSRIFPTVARIQSGWTGFWLGRPNRIRILRFGHFNVSTLGVSQEPHLFYIESYSPLCMRWFCTIACVCICRALRAYLMLSSMCRLFGTTCTCVFRWAYFNLLYLSWLFWEINGLSHFGGVMCFAHLTILKICVHEE